MIRDIENITGGLRVWAKGVYAVEAAVELLIRHGRAIHPGAPWLVSFDEDRRLVALDLDELLRESGTWSGSERRIARIATSLISDTELVCLGDAVTGLDRRNLELVLAAIAHASGSHEHSAVQRDQTGVVLGFGPLPSLHPWPPA